MRITNAAGNEAEHVLGKAMRMQISLYLLCERQWARLGFSIVELTPPKYMFGLHSPPIGVPVSVAR